MNTQNIRVLYVDGIVHADSPDFVDAYVESAEWKDTGKELTEAELDTLNEDSEFVHEAVINQIY